MIRSLRAACALLGVLALAACGSLSGTATTVQVTLAKGSLGADTAYNIAANWYLANVATFSPSLKATLKGALLKVQTCPPGAVALTDCTGYLPDYHKAVAIGDAVAEATATANINAALAPVSAAKSGAGQ